MWVFTENGFVSAVRKYDKPNLYTVRSRDWKSLETLAAKAEVEIVASPLGDYPYRVFVEPAVFTDWLSEQASQIDYNNFKSRVSTTRGHDYTDALHDVWVAMLRTQDAPLTDNENRKA